MSKHPWIRQTTNPDKPVLVPPGPTSIEGKAIFSKNAVKHGCCAGGTLILPGRETMQDYEALQTVWLDAYSLRSFPALPIKCLYPDREGEWPRHYCGAFESRGSHCSD